MPPLRKTAVEGGNSRTVLFELQSMGRRGARNKGACANFAGGVFDMSLGSTDLEAERSSGYLLCTSRGVTSPFALVDDFR